MNFYKICTTYGYAKKDSIPHRNLINLQISRVNSSSQNFKLRIKIRIRAFITFEIGSWNKHGYARTIRRECTF